MAYDAFISYSHAGDGLLAPRLQQSLQRFAKPWWRRRALRVFHDESALSANPGLWSSITDALDSAEWFVLLASPDAAASEWVNREVEYWCTHKDPSHILPVLTDGDWAWDPARGGFDVARSTAVPLALLGAFREEPRHIDMRWARSDAQLDLQNGRFRDQVAELAAPMHGLAKDDLAGDDVRQHRRTLRTAWGAVALLLVLLGASVASALVAVRSADEARASEQAAVDARTEADRQAALAVASAQEAEARQEEADASAAEASRQRVQADVNALEAERQRAAADRNAANAEAARRAADAANGELATTVDQLTATNAQLDETNGELASANDDLATANDSLDQTNQQLDDTNQALASSNQQLASTIDQLTAANGTLSAQAANLDAGRLAGLADDESARRLDVALLLAAAAERRAATDDLVPNTTLFDLVATRGRGLDRVLHFTPGLALSVAVSPNDESIATVALDDTFTTAEVSVWAADAPAGTPARTIRFPMSHLLPTQATFGAGGRHLFVRTLVPISIVDPDAPPPPEEVGLEVIDVVTGARVLSFAPSIGATIAYTPDMESAAVQTCLPAGAMDCEPTVALIDARTGSLVAQRPGRLPSHLGVGGAASPDATTDPDFSADGDHLLVFAPPGEFQLWSVSRPNVTVSLYTPATGTFTVPSFSTSGTSVVGAPNPDQVVVYDVDDGAPLRVVALPQPAPVLAVAAGLEGATLLALQAGRAVRIDPTGAITTVAVDACAEAVTASPRAQWFVVGGAACTATDFVEMATGRHLGPIVGHTLGITATDGGRESSIHQIRTRTTYPADNSFFGVYDIGENRWTTVRDEVASGATATFDRSANAVLVGFGQPARYQVWSGGTTRELPGSASVATFFGASNRFALSSTDGTIDVWHADRMTAPEQIGALPANDTGFYFLHDLSPRGDAAAYVEATDPNAVVIRHLGDDTDVDRLVFPWSVNDLAFGADGDQLLVEVLGSVQRYDIDTKTFLTSLPGELGAVSTTGRYAATAVNTSTVQITDLTTGDVRRVTVSSTSSEIVVSADGRRVVANRTLYDVLSNRALRALPILPDFTYEQLELNFDGTRLYYLSFDSPPTLQAIDLSTGAVVGSRSIRSRNGGSVIPQIELSGSGRWLWANGDLLDAATLDPIGRPGDVLPMADLPGRLVFTSGDRSVLVVVGTTVYRFVIAGDLLADEACRLVGRNLDAEERARYLAPDETVCPQWPTDR